MGEDSTAIGFVSASSTGAACLAALHEKAVRPGEPCWQAMAFEILLESGPVHALIGQAGIVPAGFVLWRVAADESEILLLAVTPDQRRRGIARGLLRRALAGAHRDGSQVMWLEVAVDNPAPIALYLSEGFERLARRPAYYQRTDGGRADALVFRRTLPRDEEIFVN